MKLSSILYLIIAFSILGCAQKEEKSPEQKIEEPQGHTVSDMPEEYGKSENDNPQDHSGNLKDTLRTASLKETSTPYLIRAKILGVRVRKYFEDDIEEPDSVDYPEYKAEAVEVLRGENFKTGDIFNFDFMSYQETHNPGHLEIGEELFLPLVRGINQYHENIFITSAYDDLPIGINDTVKFAIKNNILYDKDNFWGLGTEVPWEKFKQAFLDDVKKIKNYK